MLTSEQSEAIKNSFPALDLQLFYDTMAEKDPVTYNKFFSRPDVLQQRDRVYALVSIAASNSSELSCLFPELRVIGDEYAALGVEPEHYELFRQSLLRALRLKNPAEVVAWDCAIRAIVKVMQQDAQELPALDVHFNQDEHDAGNGVDDGAKLHDGRASGEGSSPRG